MNRLSETSSIFALFRFIFIYTLKSVPDFSGLQERREFLSL